MDSSNESVTTKVTRRSEFAIQALASVSVGFGTKEVVAVRKSLEVLVILGGHLALEIVWRYKFLV